MTADRTADWADRAAWQPAAANIYARLQEEILDGQLAPATVISEVTLSRRFGVSRAPLREAIWRLEKRGLLERSPRHRARVASVSTEQLQQLFSLREAVEGFAAREAARHITAGEIAELRAMLARQEERAERIGLLASFHHELTSDFHAAVATASRNAFVAKFLCEDYQAMIELCRRRQRRNADRAARSFVEHRRILDALEDRDEALAELQMRRHIENARQVLVAEAASTAGDPAPV